MGKHKPIYDPGGKFSLVHLICYIAHVGFRLAADCGDYVVVTNAQNIKVTGKKAQQLVYRHHTMYPGGLKEIKYKDMMRRKPDEVRALLPQVLLVADSVIDHSSSGFWDVAQEQAARTQVGAVAHLCRRRYGCFQAQHFEALGRWYFTASTTVVLLVAVGPYITSPNAYTPLSYHTHPRAAHHNTRQSLLM